MGPLIVIGNPNTVFVRQMAAYWHRQGIDIAIVTANHWTGGPVNDDGVRVLRAESAITGQTHSMLDLLLPVVADLERELHDARSDRVARALRSWAPGTPPPSLLPPLIDGLAIAELVKTLNPIAVIGNEAFAYGVATSLCHGVRRTLFAWGGDVMQFCNTSDTAERMMRQVLANVHYVVVGSEAVRQRTVSQFGVADDRTVLFSFGVDTQRFARADAARRSRVLARFGIAPDAQVVLNARRLRPYWGSEVAVEALLQSGLRHRDAHLICLGGLGTEAEAAAARRCAQDAGLAARFLALEGDAPEDTIAELMSVADVFLSLAKEDEPLSLSVVQGAAAGGAPIIGDQTTYRDAANAGLAAALVAGDSSSQVADAISALLKDPARRKAMAAANQRYVAREHNRDTHMTRLLRIVTGNSVAEQLLGAATAGHVAQS